jgi:hypothetical protein
MQQGTTCMQSAASADCGPSTELQRAEALVCAGRVHAHVPALCVARHSAAF